MSQSKQESKPITQKTSNSGIEFTDNGIDLNPILLEQLNDRFLELPSLSLPVTVGGESLRDELAAQIKFQEQTHTPKEKPAVKVSANQLRVWSPNPFHSVDNYIQFFEGQCRVADNHRINGTIVRVNKALKITEHNKDSFLIPLAKYQKFSRKDATEIIAIDENGTTGQFFFISFNYHSKAWKSLNSKRWQMVSTATEK